VKFLYTQIPPSAPDGLPAFRPIVKAKLFGPRRTLKLDMLVDSGSDESVIHSSQLDAVGATYTGETITLRGLGGAESLGRVARLRVEVAGIPYDARLVGVEHRQQALLGQRDFFRNFVVQFDLDAGLFFVSRVNRRRH
jgi:hypothetical protein